MNRTILLTILWSLSISIGWAQETDTPTIGSTPTAKRTKPSALYPADPAFRPAEPALYADPAFPPVEPKRMIIHPGVDAQESEAAMEFMTSLEQAGIAKINMAMMTPASGSPIQVAVFMRKDESLEKMKQFIVALRHSGVEQMTLEFGGTYPDGLVGKGEQNTLAFRATSGYSQDELQRLEKAARTAAEHCGLSLYLAGTIITPSEQASAAQVDPEAASFEVPQSSREVGSATDTVISPNAGKVAQLRTDYETANKQAHALAELLRKTPDAAKKAELRTAVQQAFTLRQSLLRAELLEMQTRLLQTQQSLDMRERIADQIVDRRVEDLLNPQLEWKGSSTSETAGSTALNPAKTTNALPSPAAAVITELEGDWHRMAVIYKWETERRPCNLSIRGNRWTGTDWTGRSVSSSLVVDAEARTIDFGTLKGELPVLTANERGTYELEGEILTIHSESTIVDSEIGTQKQQQTNIWKRGLCEIQDYDSRNPGEGMDLFHLNGNEIDTGHGKLVPGDKVDVIVSFTPLNQQLVQRVLVEKVEVDGSSEPQPNRPHRQVSLLGTREQCLVLNNTPKHGTLSLVARNPEHETLQYPNGINAEAYKELEAAASVAPSELERD